VKSEKNYKMSDERHPKLFLTFKYDKYDIEEEMQLESCL
jgi:hypothetical protein